MTEEETPALSETFSKASNQFDRIHWLPFAAKEGSEITKCDVEGYFVTKSASSGEHMSSTFRGRVINGLEMNTQDFTIIAENPKRSSQGGSVEVKKLVVWNHDDIPLNSDVVPQALALARLQQHLGTSD